jgi:hypothetical protein
MAPLWPLPAALPLHNRSKCWGKIYYLFSLPTGFSTSLCILPTLFLCFLPWWLLTATVGSKLALLRSGASPLLWHCPGLLGPPLTVLG